jgi:hypothetical protein
MNSVESREFRFRKQTPATHFPGIEVVGFVHAETLVIVVHRDCCWAWVESAIQTMLTARNISQAQLFNLR